MKLSLTIALSALILTATALPFPFSALSARNCQPAEGVATDGNQYWADNCDLGAGENGWGQKARRMVDSIMSKRHGPGHWGSDDKNNDNNNNKDNNNNNNNGGHDALWNGVYEQTPNCTPADGVATDGNQFWADNCDLGAGENGFGQ